MLRNDKGLDNVQHVLSLLRCPTVSVIHSCMYCIYLAVIHMQLQESK